MLVFCVYLFAFSFAIQRYASCMFLLWDLNGFGFEPQIMVPVQVFQALIFDFYKL